MKLLPALLLPLLLTPLVAEPYLPPGDRKASPGNTNYFIDPAKGDDNRAGTARDKAWKSFVPLNKLRLAAGDRVEVTGPGAFHETLALSGGGTAERPVTVRFAPGRYDFHPTRLYREAYQISNTNALPDHPKAVAILLKEAHHIHLTGPGASMVHRGKMIEVCIDESNDITISILAFDYHRPTVSEYTVVARTDDHVDIKVHRDSTYTIEDGKITWQGEGWSNQEGLTQELDPDTNEVWRRRDPLKNTTAKEVAPFHIRLTGQTDLKPGRTYQVRKTERDCAGVFTRRSRNITWRDVHFRFLHGMGLVCQFTENLSFERVRIAPDPESGRTTAAWADGIHASGCRGHVLIKDCHFEGTHDDPVNIHGTHLRIVEKLSDRQLKVRFMHKQTFGFLAFNPGDEIELVRTDSMATHGPNTVAKAELVSPTDLLVTLKDPVPGDFRIGDAMENVTWTPSVEIRGCTMRRIPTRGFLLTTRRKIVVEDNTFQRTRMSAILVENGATGWFESGCVRDMTIRNNRFLHCAEPVINIHPQNSVPNDAVHQDIRILENLFELRRQTAVRAKSTRNLLFTGNSVVAPEQPDDTSAVSTQDCSGLIVRDNNYRKRP